MVRYHIRDGMSSVGNNRSATSKITRQSFPGRQPNVGGEAQPENVLGLLARLIAMVMRMTDVPPLRNLEVRAVRWGEGMAFVELGRTEGLNCTGVRVEMEAPVGLRVESGKVGSVNGIEVVEFEEAHFLRGLRLL